MTLYDLVVIGSGPGGLRAAISASKMGKKVAIVEDHNELGGSSVHWGTIPSKSFRESVYRWSLGSTRKKGELPDMKRLLQRRDKVVGNEAGLIRDQLRRNGVEIHHGRARLLSQTEVEVTSKKAREKLTAQFIVLAVGARPVSPAHAPVDGKVVHDSNTILSLKKVPKSMVVWGGGIIGCEYASIFSTAGTKVHLVDRRHEILAAVDREIVSHLMERMEDQGLEVVLDTEVKRVEKREGGVRVELASGRKINADCLLVALGRYGNTEALGLEAAGIDSSERGLIDVNQYFQTTAPNIYAIGDVIGPPALAATSAEQGSVATHHAFQNEVKLMPENFPYGIYTIPEISMVGLTEDEASARKLDVIIGRARYNEIARGHIVGDPWGLLKLVADRKSLKLLGVHVMGDAAANLVHIGQAVMDFGGDVNYFVRTIFNYPTLAEAYKVAAFDIANQLRDKR